MQPPRDRAFDLRDRTFAFARDVLRAYPLSANRHDPSRVAWRQLVRAATSVGANFEEARAASSRADFHSRVGIAVREAREARYWLRLIGAAALAGAPEARPLEHEASELVAILTTIARKTDRRFEK